MDIRYLLMKKKIRLKKKKIRIPLPRQRSKVRESMKIYTRKRRLRIKEED